MPGIGGLLSLGTGLLGAGAAYKGHRDHMALANQPSQGELQSAFSNTQGLIDRMTNFGQYSAPAMDMATQAGNQGVQTAMMAGMGGSQANAIRNRLRNSGINQAYSNFNQGIGDAARLQMGIDQNVSNQMAQNRQFSNAIKMQGAKRMMGIGSNLIGPQGLPGLIGQIGTMFG